MEPVDNVTVEQRLAAIEEKLDLVLARLAMLDGNAVGTVGGPSGGVADAVPAGWNAGPAVVSGPGPLLPQPDDELLELVRRGKKIQAIKVYRERTGASLRDAKDAVDAMSEQERFRSGRR